MAAGIDANTELQGIVFSSEGYSDPQFFNAVFEGRLNAINAKAVSVYL